jgi:hypothetical protein
LNFIARNVKLGGLRVQRCCTDKDIADASCCKRATNENTIASSFQAAFCG